MALVPSPLLTNKKPANYCNKILIRFAFEVTINLVQRKKGKNTSIQYTREKPTLSFFPGRIYTLEYNDKNKKK